MREAVVGKSDSQNPSAQGAAVFPVMANCISYSYAERGEKRDIFNYLR